jgi:hypothetical protein
MLYKRLGQIARRLRLHNALRGAVAGLALGLIAALVALAASKFRPFPMTLPIAAGLAALGPLAGAIVGAIRRVTLRMAAIHADHTAGTDEILSSALEFGSDSRVGPVLTARAEKTLASLPTARLVPPLGARVPWTSLALAAAFAALCFVPAISWSRPDDDKTAAINPAILQALERNAKEIKRVGDQSDNKQLSHLGQEMQRLAQQAKLGELTKKEALAKIAALSERAEQIKQEMDAKKDALAKLEKSPETKGIADALAKGDNAGAKSKAEELADKLGKGDLNDAQKKDLKETLESMSKSSKGELADAAQEAAEAMDSGDAQKFGDKMERLADKMKGARSGSGKGEGKPGAGQKAEGEQELDEGRENLSDAQDDLSGDETAGSQKYCEDCGKRKDSEKGG